MILLFTFIITVLPIMRPSNVTPTRKAFKIPAWRKHWGAAQYLIVYLHIRAYLAHNKVISTKKLWHAKNTKVYLTLTSARRFSYILPWFRAQKRQIDIGFSTIYDRIGLLTCPCCCFFRFHDHLPEKYQPKKHKKQ